MLYQDAVSVFGETLNIDASDRRFMITLVDPEVSEDDILIRLEISFLEDLSELKPGAQGGRFQSIKSGRLSAALLVDWKLINEENGKAFIDFCREWDASAYYVKGSQAQKCLLTNGTVTASLTEFTGPTGISCAGMTRVAIAGGKIAVGGGATREARNFVKTLLGKTATPAPKASELLF